MKDLSTLARVVRERRQAKGLTQFELADQAQLGRGWISQIEREGIETPGIDGLQKLAAVLDVPERYLFALGGHQLGVVPEVKERTIADVLDELARTARKVQERADGGDDAAEAELRHLARAFAGDNHRALLHTGAGFLSFPSR